MELSESRQRSGCCQQGLLEGLLSGQQTGAIEVANVMKFRCARSRRRKRRRPYATRHETGNLQRKDHQTRPSPQVLRHGQNSGLAGCAQLSLAPRWPWRRLLRVRPQAPASSMVSRQSCARLRTKSVRNTRSSWKSADRQVVLRRVTRA